MSTYRYCDWTKKRIKSGEKVTIIKISYETPAGTGEELQFELGEAAAKHILDVLLADDEIADVVDPAPQVSTVVVKRDTQAARGENTTPTNIAPLNLEIPDDPNARLGTPSMAVWERVMADAKRFEPGTLSSLSPGQGRQQASEKLAEIEQRRESDLKRQGGQDFNVKNL